MRRRGKAERADMTHPAHTAQPRLSAREAERSLATAMGHLAMALRQAQAGFPIEDPEVMVSMHWAMDKLDGVMAGRPI